jgi:hypothetical protein
MAQGFLEQLTDSSLEIRFIIVLTETRRFIHYLEATTTVLTIQVKILCNCVIQV